MSTPKPTKKLTERQERFCHEFLIDGNAAAAAVRAGYAAKDANSQGARLSANVSIKKRLGELRAELFAGKKDAGLLAIEEFQRIALMPDAARRKQKLDWAAKIRALENLGKISGIYEEHNRQKQTVIVIGADDAVDG